MQLYIINLNKNKNNFHLLFLSCKLIINQLNKHNKSISKHFIIEYPYRIIKKKSSSLIYNLLIKIIIEKI